MPSLAKSQGGVAHAVVRLCEAGCSFGSRQSVVTVQTREPELTLDPARVATMRVPPYRLGIPKAKGSSSFQGQLKQHVLQHEANILHSHGIWAPANHSACAVARSLGIPLVVSTHGMLAPWCLSHKAWKKRLAWWLYQHRDLRIASVLRATSPAEARDLRAAGLRQPIAFVPNGIEMPPLTTGQPSVSPSGQGIPTRKLVFLGRIYPVKGLLNLIEAWDRVRPAHWTCVIAGPDEAGHRQELEAELSRRKLAADFQFPGPVDDSAKWRLLAEADLFVLPSFTENFGLVVAEALASGVPVITTTGTPWEDLVTHDCGWWVAPNPEALAGALQQATTASEARLRDMGRRGSAFVRKRYPCDVVAREMHSVYEWMLHRGPKPACMIDS